jgi:hypothetical protein
MSEREVDEISSKFKEAELKEPPHYFQSASVVGI